MGQYTALTPSIMPPPSRIKKQVGRPRQYSNEAASRRINRENALLQYHRRKIGAGELRGPADFIAYEPPPPKTPIATPPEIGLWISQDIRIPVEEGIRERNIEETNTQEVAGWGAPCQTTLAQTTNPRGVEEDTEIAQQVRQIRESEQENSAEQEQYEARVTVQMTTAEYEAAETLRALQGASEERQRSVGVSVPRIRIRILSVNSTDRIQYP
jgi:hypothetical protein